MTTPMRVLIVSQYFWPENFRINSVAVSLCQRGVEVDVLTALPNYPSGKFFSGYKFFGPFIETFEGVNIMRSPIIPRGSGSSIGLMCNYLSFIFLGLIFGLIHTRNKKYDVIFINGLSPILSAIPAIFLAKIKSVPTVLWVQDLWPESLSATGHIGNKKILNIVGMVVRWIYRNINLILVQSKGFIGSVKNYSPSSIIKYYPNSVEISHKNDLQNINLKLEGFDCKFPVLFTGNLGAAQDLQTILQMAIRLQPYEEIKIIIVGDGSKKEWMIQKAKEYSLINVHFLGRLPPEYMGFIMDKAFVLLATLADQKIFSLTIPSKIQTYLAAGKPIVAAINGEGARVLLESGAGFVAPCGDGEALAEIVLTLTNKSKHEILEIGINGKNYAERYFSHNLLMGELFNHLESVQ